MPTYEYACKACGERLEVVQSFSDAPLTECPNCGGELRKVFQPIGIAFKGSGFYKTDSRKSSSATSSSSTGSSESKSETKSETKSESKTESSKSSDSSSSKSSDSSSKTPSTGSSSAAAS